MFEPAWPLANAHLQTVVPAIVRHPRTPRMVRECWETPDGDALDLERLDGDPAKPGVIVMHGLESSSRAGYVRGMIARAAARGWSAVAVNFRSCGPTPHRLVGTYHSGFTRDIAMVAERMRARWPRTFAIGFSLGGNVLLKWLGEESRPDALDAAVAISVPFDLAACARALDGPGFWARVYRRRFLSSLKRKARATAKRFPGRLDVSRLAAADTFSLFDDLVTAPVHGFADASDYWTRSSSGPFLPRIRVPTLLVHAEDDPFIPKEAIPREAIAANPALTLALTELGGHVGFLGGSLLRPAWWAERTAFDFLDRHIQRDAA